MDEELLARARHEAREVCFVFDSHSAIHLAKNSSYHSRTKHIDVRYHWIRDVVSSKLLKLEKIHTDDNGSDMMTKILPNEKLQACCKVAGMAVPPS